MDRHHWRALCAPLFLSLSFSSHASVIISEVFYDASGSDNGKVFVELYGTAGTDLGGWSLVGINGSNGSTTHDISLSGFIPSDGVFVIADTNGGISEVGNADMLVSNIDLQNGPDSVQLLQGATVMDALGYGVFGTGDTFAGEGNAAAAASAGESLARLSLVDSNDNFTDFVAGLSTPGVVSAVPVPAAIWLFGSGLLGLMGVARRRGLTPR